MAHQLATFTDANGREQHCCLSVRELPWHRLGTVIPDTVSPAEALRLAGLTWTVDSQPIYTSDLRPIPQHRALVRSDTHAVLGLATDSYAVVQNHEIATFLDQIVAEGAAQIETAGAVRDGALVWLLARTPGELRLGDDVSYPYLLVSAGHDARRPIQIAPVLTRPVCANTLAMADAEIRARRGSTNRLAAGYRIRHTAGVRAALDDVAAAYRAALASLRVTQQAAELLARTSLTATRWAALMEAAFAGEEAPSESTRSAAIRAARLDAINGILVSDTCTVRGSAGSLWAGVNAIGEWIDHRRGTRTGDDGASADEQRLVSATWGSGAQAKARAWSTALALAGA
jgi:phage/plasmid-like protein (TIGR03299 family)